MTPKRKEFPVFKLLKKKLLLCFRINIFHETAPRVISDLYNETGVERQGAFLPLACLIPE
jgi:hypothetical protein